MHTDDAKIIASLSHTIDLVRERLTTLENFGGQQTHLYSNLHVVERLCESAQDLIRQTRKADTDA